MPAVALASEVPVQFPKRARRLRPQDCPLRLIERPPDPENAAAPGDEPGADGSTWEGAGDIKRNAASVRVEDHLGLVHNIAAAFWRGDPRCRFKGGGRKGRGVIEFDDLVSIGTFGPAGDGKAGLARAIELWNPALGRISTIATPWIRAAINRYLDQVDGVIHIPEKHLQDLRAAKRQTGAMTLGEWRRWDGRQPHLSAAQATTAALRQSASLDVLSRDVDELLPYRLSYSDPTAWIAIANLERERGPAKPEPRNRRPVVQSPIVAGPAAWRLNGRPAPEPATYRPNLHIAPQRGYAAGRADRAARFAQRLAELGAKK